MLNIDNRYRAGAFFSSLNYSASKSRGIDQPTLTSVRRLRPHNVTVSARRDSFGYSIKFSTILPPSNITNMELLNHSISMSTKSLSDRFVIKQSYMLLTWASYVTNNSTNLGKESSRPSFAHLPIRRRRFTITKAPMAHKTFSQEQYQYQFYTLIISFRSGQIRFSDFTPSINESIYLSLMLRRSALKFNLGTNLFLVSRLKINQTLTDKVFFSQGL